MIVPGHTAEVRLTRGEFEEMIRSPLLRTVDALRRAVEDSGVAPEELSAVLLVGGSSRIPLVAELVGGEFRVPIVSDAHPKFTVCLGAAIAAAPRLGGPPRTATPRLATRGDAAGGQPRQERRERPSPHPLPADPADLLTDAPGARDAPTVEVDLVSNRLTEPGDVPLRPAAGLAGALGPITDRDVPLRILVGGDDAYRRGAMRRVLIVATLALLVVLAVSLLAALRSRLW